MRRRNFITLLGGAAAWPLAASAQQGERIRRVAVLAPVRNPAFDIFRAQLQQLGYSEGRDIWLDFRTADGRIDRLPALAEELVRDGATDVILADSTPAAVAARRATKTIPIVAYIAVDPVAAGLATSLARPGGNVTGVSFFAEELNAKRVELLHQVAPQARRFAAIAGKTASDANSPGNLRATADAARKLSLAMEVITVNDPATLRDDLSPTELSRFDGFVVVPDIILTAHIADVVALLGASGRPAVYFNRVHAEAGGLMSYGQDITDTYRRLASQLDRVLKGAVPNDLPFERPTKFELVINLKTAKALGLEVSPTLLVRADEVIE